MAKPTRCVAGAGWLRTVSAVQYQEEFSSLSKDDLSAHEFLSLMSYVFRSLNTIMVPSKRREGTVPLAMSFCSLVVQRESRGRKLSEPFSEQHYWGQIQTR